MMRWGIFLSLLTVSVCLAVNAAFAGEPAWALISTEVDDELDGAGTFMDREVLTLWPAPGENFPWSYDANDVYFDPADVLGMETGLDAFHVAHEAAGDLLFFSTEVDFEFEGIPYENEDLLVYDTSSGLMTQAMDVKDLLGTDYGLDAASWLYEPNDAKWLLAFSTEVGGEVRIPDDGVNALVPFTDGDILVTDGIEVVGILNLEEVFGRNVGLDALHVTIETDDQIGAAELMYLQVLLSTEVDGTLPPIDGDATVGAQPLVEFNDEDIVSLTFELLDGPGVLLNAEVPWRGIEDGFGDDVGLDALYVEIPEPATVVLVGLGLGAYLIRRRNRG